MDLFVARQPIFDTRGELEAYELLYRRGAGSLAADGESTGQMSLDVIIQSLLGIGLDQITRGKTSFLNFSRDMLLSGCYDLLDRNAVVVELLEDVEADDEVVAACERLTTAGYRLALDDFEPGAGHEVLLPLAEIIKVDVLNRSADEVRAVAEPLKRRGLRLLAERVETAEVRDSCTEMGFELFQGYFFSRPEVIARRGASVEQTGIVRLMNLLGDERAGDQEIEEAFRGDPSLSYKLLRMVNAASHGGHGIDSILHAVRLLGRTALHRWLALLLASSLATRGGIDTELVHAAILRARLCELLGARTGRAPSGTLFMVGLFSRMDALMRTPMEDIVAEINLSEEVKAALLHRRGPYASWLELAEAYEAGEWETMSSVASTLGISPLEIPEIYIESVQWARERLVDFSGGS